MQTFVRLSYNERSSCFRAELSIMKGVVLWCKRLSDISIMKGVLWYKWLSDLAIMKGVLWCKRISDLAMCRANVSELAIMEGVLWRKRVTYVFNSLSITSVLIISVLCSTDYY